MDDAPWFRHYEEGVPRTIPCPEITLPEALDQTARRFPDRAAEGRVPERAAEVDGGKCLRRVLVEEERAPKLAAP